MASGLTRAFDIPLNPGSRNAFPVTTQLGDTEQEIPAVAIRLRFRWHERIKLYTCRVETPDGAELSPELAVQAGAVIPWSNTDPRVPQGRLLWLGPDVYTRESLGQTLRLVYVPIPRPANGGEVIPPV